MKNIFSIHWGLSVGGISRYAATIENVSNFAPIKLRSLCFLQKGRSVDQSVLKVLDATVFPFKSALDLSWILQLKKHILTGAPDCVLSHGFNGHLASIIGCSGNKHIRQIATYHGNYHAFTFIRKILGPVYNHFTYWFMRNKARAILCVSQYCADFLSARGVSPAKITVIHNGIPDIQERRDSRETIRSEWSLSHNEILIGIASRFDPIKGLDYLIEAFSLIAPKHPAAKLVLMGEGIMRNALEAQVRKARLNRKVLFVGVRSDVPQCLAALDIFVLPSLSESHSIGLLEAMRAGLPIIATDVGGNTESVRNNVDGLIVRPADTQGLAEALSRILNNENLRKKLGTAARQRFLSEFTEEAMLKKTAAWFHSVCCG